MRRFATTADSVYYALKKIQLDLVHRPKFDPRRDIHSIFIYADIEAYHKAVRVQSSAGYHSRSERSVFLRKDKFISSQKPNSQLLVHELPSYWKKKGLSISFHNN